MTPAIPDRRARLGSTVTPARSSLRSSAGQGVERLLLEPAWRQVQPPSLLREDFTRCGYRSSLPMATIDRDCSWPEARHYRYRLTEWPLASMSRRPVDARLKAPPLPMAIEVAR
jgi:hypothetical protein